MEFAGFPVFSIMTAFVIVLLGASVSGLTGFGFALFSVPLLLLLFEAKLVVVLSLGLAPALCVLIVWRSRQHLYIRGICPIVIASFAGIPFGALVLTLIGESLLKLLTSFVVLSFAALVAVGYSYSLRNQGLLACATGFVAGALTNSVGLGGPPVVLFLVNQRWSKEMFRVNLAAYFAITYFFGLLVVIPSGLVTAGVATLILLLIPGTLMGELLGEMLVRRIAADQFRRLAITLVIGAAILGMAGELGRLLQAGI